MPCRWHLRLGGRYEVRRGNDDLGSPPTQCTATLLAVLALRGEAWTGREECAARLYPDSPQAGALNALRQTLFRLRRWLGPGAIESEEHRLRIAPGAVRVDVHLPDGREAAGALIAPGIAHPWLEALRERSNGAEVGEEGPGPVAAYLTAVEEVSAVDLDAARCLLVGGREMAQRVDPGRMLELVRRTRPHRRADVCAVEHAELQGELLYRTLALSEAEQAFRRAVRLATHHGDREAVCRTEAMLGFVLLESGRLEDARNVAALLPHPRRGAAGQLMGTSLAAELLWSEGRLSEALKTLEGARPFVESQGRHAKLCYWCNLAVLAAEVGHLEKVQEGRERAAALSNPFVDHWASLMLGLAEGEELMVRRRPEEAAVRLEQVVCVARREGFPLRSLYAMEAEAEALARAGDPRRAWITWRSAERLRQRAGLRPTPRLEARKGRLLALV